MSRAYRSAAMCLSGVLLLAVLLPGAVRAQQDDTVARGEYLVIAGGCTSCHTDIEAKGRPFAGGAGIATPFGTFFPPNITSDPEHGIGRWTEAEFDAAMRRGVRPDGAHLFPSFPYTSYTQIAAADIRAMYAYLMTVPPVADASRPHDLAFPFGWRFLQVGWKILFFREGEFQPDPSATAEINRGAYLANALAHCGECHTPRNMLGGLDLDRWMAGTADGPEGSKVPNITPDPDTGLSWSADEIADYLRSGLTPDGDFVGSLMADVISHSTGRMTAEDVAAIAAYLKSLPPVNHSIGAGR